MVPVAGILRSNLKIPATLLFFPVLRNGHVNAQRPRSPWRAFHSAFQGFRFLPLTTPAPASRRQCRGGRPVTGRVDSLLHTGVGRLDHGPEPAHAVGAPCDNRHGRAPRGQLDSLGPAEARAPGTHTPARLRRRDAQRKRRWGGSLRQGARCVKTSKLQVDSESKRPLSQSRAPHSSRQPTGTHMGIFITYLVQ